jgi:DnaK suppressor protein
MARTRPGKSSAAVKRAAAVKGPAAVKRPAPVKGPPARKPAAAEKTNPAVVQAELKALLLAKRAELVAKLREEREGRREATEREKIEGTPFGDRPGLSPDDEMGFAVADRRAGMLAQIDLALKKMEEGSYGRCEVCEEPINGIRLRAHPFAVRCTRCQEAWEREQLRVDAAPVRARAVPEETA